MDSTRTQRLAQELQREIALIIHQEIEDPRLGFVTITRVELSKDVRYAKVLFSCLGSAQERARSQEALDHSARFIHSLIKKRFRLKIIPTITFLYDASIESSIELSKTFEQLKPLSDDEGLSAS